MFGYFQIEGVPTEAAAAATQGPPDVQSFDEFIDIVQFGDDPTEAAAATTPGAAALNSAVSAVAFNIVMTSLTAGIKKFEDVPTETVAAAATTALGSFALNPDVDIDVAVNVATTSPTVSIDEFEDISIATTPAATPSPAPFNPAVPAVAVNVAAASSAPKIVAFDPYPNVAAPAVVA